MTNSAQTSKMQSFFEGNRREASLVKWTHLRTTAGESRIKMELVVPLLNKSVIGMGGAIGEAFGVMAKDDSKIERTNLKFELEGMTVEFFTTAESKRRSISSTGVRMQKLALVASGEGEKRQLDLQLTAYMPANEQIRDWAWLHLHKQFHLEAVYSQTEMDFDGADGGKIDDDEDEGEETGKAAKKAAAAKAGGKSGPKDLLAFHAKPN